MHYPSLQTRKIYSVLSVALLLLLSFAIREFWASTETEVANEPYVDSQAITPIDSLPYTTESAIVTRVIDGDTIELENGNVIRYIGIDTPETKHPQKQKECFAAEATAYNKSLVLHKTVYLEKDVSEKDRYGRMLRYVYLNDSDRPDTYIMINETLAEKGYAFASSYPPDIKHQDLLDQAEARARLENRGLWSTCDYSNTSPSNTPASPSISATPRGSIPDPLCAIKGNINSAGLKIYHIPGCKSYDETVIHTSKGETWFCSEEDAIVHGWEKARNCY